ncbi:putative bifunctional diguanylate cyclase/phosphodiesterase [Azospirillum sp.]|uniref:putative bifunctional diguanylate cyclase/phosphodiesterase n=1 Tax=Azospirillum sp. TaxID=34012 RepID=UPI002D4820B0|nr:EAL domain-containing protein [Azospirillum sp.]HYD65735.1 EAL domain-containing protein [Azospirillum sp.]
MLKSEKKSLWCGLALIAAFTSLTLAYLWNATLTELAHDRTMTEAAARGQAADFARAFEARLIDRIERIDHALLHIRDELGEVAELASGRLAALRHRFDDPALIQIARIDANGRLIDSTLSHTAGQDLSDREHFLVHRDRPADSREDRLFISKPLRGRLSQRWTLQFTRRIDHPDGRFAGVLVFSINPYEFAELAHDLPVGQEGVVSIIGSDRVIRMVRTGNDDPARRAWIGRELDPARPYFDPAQPAADVVRVVSHVDSRALWTAYRRLSHSPLIVAVQLSETEIFGPMEERAAFLRTNALGFSAIVLLCAAGLAVLSLSQYRTRMALSAANERLRRSEQELEERVRQRTQALERSNRHVQELAYTDTLTGLPNRVLFADRAAHAVRCAAREGRTLAILLLDLDHFKVVNDTLGHPSGDTLLVMVAAALRRAVRPSDPVARMGGDEFVILTEGLANANDAAHVAEQILAELGKPVALDGQTLHPSASIGIAVFPDDGTDLPTLLKNADAAMYAAKAAGRNTLRYFNPVMAQAAEQRLALVPALRFAVEEGDFRLDYQPKVCIATGELCGVEALIRWKHPERGDISPAEFIPLAEEVGLIQPLGSWVLNEACRAIADWNAVRFGPLHVAVNVAAAQINRGDLAAEVDRVTRLHRIDPSQLQIEITETAVIGDPDRALATLNRLRSLGVEVALDDFGTGYSSLVYLRHLDIDAIKIDRSFLGKVQPGSRDAEIVGLIIRLARALEMSVIAEGVETEAHVAFLRSAGCDMMQGYLVARPMPLAELQTWIAMRQAPAPHTARALIPMTIR